MFGNSVFGGGSNSSLEDLQRNYQMQLQQIQNIQQQQQQQRPDGLLQELNNLVTSMTSEEQELLLQDTNYIQAKQIYESSFMGFLSNKFAGEFASGEGKPALENLVNNVKTCKQNISSKLKEQRDKMAALSKLMESDPEIKQKLNDILAK